jgi:hypothetical protein
MSSTRQTGSVNSARITQYHFHSICGQPRVVAARLWLGLLQKDTEIAHMTVSRSQAPSRDPTSPISVLIHIQRSLVLKDGSGSGYMFSYDSLGQSFCQV